MVIRIVEVSRAIRLELPFPPTTNNLTAVVRGRKILSAEGRAYYALVRGLLLAARTPRAPAGVQLAVEMDVYPPDRRRRDIANLEKASIDGVVHAGIIADDSLIDRLVITRRAVVAGGKVVLTIRPYDPEEDAP